MKLITPLFTLLLLILGFSLLVTGCGSKQNQDFFDNVEEQIHTQMESTASVKNDEEIKKAQEDTKVAFHITNLPEYWFNFGVYAKRWAAVVIVASLAGGWIVYDIFKKNREVQKWALGLLVIRIPIFTFLIVYVYAFLYRMLNL